MKKLLLLILFSFSAGFSAYAQRGCATESYSNQVLTNIPALSGRYGVSSKDPHLTEKLQDMNGLITIPVKVHVVYKNLIDSIPVDRIMAQIEEVNKDFAGLDDSLGRVPDHFRHLIANCGIRFELDPKDIRYTQTAVDTFYEYDRDVRDDDPLKDKIKFDQYGGQNGDASTKYMNLWIGAIAYKKPKNGEQLLGYGTYPGGIGKYDGVVVFSKAIGPGGPMANFDQGKTLTHELGHWLNLRHLWGPTDNACGSDTVGDTPQQRSCNTEMPTFPHISNCEGISNGPDGDLFMNYMDYVYDEGMCMFTTGQKARMRALFVAGGMRSSFIHSTAANANILAASPARNDAKTPEVTNIKDHVNPQVNAVTGKTVSWTPVDNIKKYIFQSRLLGSKNWITQATTGTKVLLNKLKADALYEVRLQTVDKSGTTSAASTPYIFKNSPVQTTQTLK
jgi:hypothetical protein